MRGLGWAKCAVRRTEAARFSRKAASQTMVWIPTHVHPRCGAKCQRCASATVVTAQKGCIVRTMQSGA